MLERALTGCVTLQIGLVFALFVVFWLVSDKRIVADVDLTRNRIPQVGTVVYMKLEGWSFFISCVGLVTDAGLGHNADMLLRSGSTSRS